MINVISIALIVVLIVVIVEDLRSYTIRNRIIAVLLGLSMAGLIVQADAGRAIANVLFAGVAFGLLAFAFHRGWMGGGDAKLLSVAFLQIGPLSLSRYALSLLLLTILYWAGARLGFCPARREDGRLRIPFGPSIAGAWIVELVLSLPVATSRWTG